MQNLCNIVKFAALALCAAPAVAAQPLAMVTDLYGHASLERRHVKRPLLLMQEVQRGDRIALSNGAHAVLVYAKTAEAFQLSGPGRFIAGESGVGALGKGSTLDRKLLAPAFRNLRLKPLALGQASVVMRGAESPKPVAPLGAALAGYGLRFEWQTADAPQLAAVRFVLVDDEGTLLFQQDLTGTSLTLPQSLKLVAGRRYAWAVTQANDAARADLLAARDAVEFWLVDDATRRRLTEAQSGTTFTERFLYAAMLEEAGLAEEARGVWDELSKRSDSASALAARAR